MKYQEVKAYWEKRALDQGTSPQATTMDFFMRQIEIKCLKNSVAKFARGKDRFNVADIGCGNGYSTIELAKDFPEIEFRGYDYSRQMIKYAKENRKNSNSRNVKFTVLDIIQENLNQKFNLIYTDRCLINLPSWELQMLAIKKIAQSLVDGGIYLMIENFWDGHNNFNELRRQFGLSEIPIRDHNLYLENSRLESFLKEYFDILSFENISSQHYLVSRIVYSKICKHNNIEPDYFDIHHELGSRLPFSGNFGPICMCQLRRKK